MVQFLEKSALILMDFQTCILDNYIADKLKEETLKNAERLLKQARKNDMMIIHVIVHFRENYPEISLQNKIFSDIKRHNLMPADSANINIIDRLKPLPEEAIIDKKRVSAFSASDLDMILRANHINTLYLAGVTTSQVVLSTFKQAIDLDYNVAIIGDACGDIDIDIHQFLLDKIFLQGGTVITTEKFLSSLEKS